MAARSAALLLCGSLAAASAAASNARAGASREPLSASARCGVPLVGSGAPSQQLQAALSASPVFFVRAVGSSSDASPAERCAIESALRQKLGATSAVQLLQAAARMGVVPPTPQG